MGASRCDGACAVSWEAADTDHDVLDDDLDKASPSLSRLLVMTRRRHPGLNPGDEPVTCLRVPEQVPAMSWNL
jgi:hypothetical protein